jgi:hypothetical protein
LAILAILPIPFNSKEDGVLHDLGDDFDHPCRVLLWHSADHALCNQKPVKLIIDEHGGAIGFGEKTGESLMVSPVALP